MSRAFLAYVVVLAAGGWLIARRHPGAWVTTRALTLNEQIEAGDVRWRWDAGGPGSLGIHERPVGQHMRGPRRPGVAVHRRDVGRYPTLRFPTQRQLLWTLSADHQPELVRPGFLRGRSRLLVCVASGGGDTVPDPCASNELIAVHRAVRDGDSSFLVLALSEDDLRWLTKTLGAERTVVLVER